MIAAEDARRGRSQVELDALKEAAAQLEAMLAAKYLLPPIFERRGLDWTVGAAVLDRLPALVQSVDGNCRERDWPVLATALALDCPIWTEDADFFGSGVATWTSETVPLYLHSPDSAGS